MRRTEYAPGRNKGTGWIDKAREDRRLRALQRDAKIVQSPLPTSPRENEEAVDPKTQKRLRWVGGKWRPEMGAGEIVHKTLTERISSTVFIGGGDELRRHAALHAEDGVDSLEPYDLAALTLTTPQVDADAALRLLPTTSLLIGEADGAFRRIVFGDNPTLSTSQDMILYGSATRTVAPSGYTYNVQEMARFALTATWDDATKGIRGVVGTAGPTGAGRVSSSAGGHFTSYGKSSVLAPLLQGLEGAAGPYSDGGGATLARGGSFWTFNADAESTLATGVAVAILDAPTYAGTITTQIGVDIPELIRGGTNYLIRTAAGTIKSTGAVTWSGDAGLTLSPSLLTFGSHVDAGAHYQDLANLATPATPGAGVRRLYAHNTTGELSVVRSDGVVRSLEGLLDSDSPTLTGVWNFNAAHLQLPTGAAWPTTSLGTGDIFLYRPEPATDPPSTARLGVYIPANDEEAAAWKYPVCRDDDGVATTGSWAFVNQATAGLASFAPSNAAQVPVTIRGYAEQAADLLKIQDSTPTDLLTVSAAGVLTCDSPVITGTAAMASLTSSGTAGLATMTASGNATVTGDVLGGDLRVRKATQGFLHVEAPGNPTIYAYLGHTGSACELFSTTGNITVAPVQGALVAVNTYAKLYNGTGAVIPANATCMADNTGTGYAKKTTGASVTGLVGIPFGAVSNTGWGYHQVTGIASVTCNGAVNIQDSIEASATAGEGRAATAPFVTGAIIGTALSSKAAAGSSLITVLLRSA